MSSSGQILSRNEYNASNCSVLSSVKYFIDHEEESLQMFSYDKLEITLKAFLDFSAIASFLNSIVSSLDESMYTLSTQFELIFLSQKHNIHIPAVCNQAQYQKWKKQLNLKSDLESPFFFSWQQKASI